MIRYKILWNTKGHTNPIEGVGESWDVRHGFAIASSKGSHADCSWDYELRAQRVLLEFLKEREEIGRVAGWHDIAANAWLIRVFPAGGKRYSSSCEGIYLMNSLKVKTIKLVLRRQLGHSFHKNGTVGRRRHVGREELWTGPSTNGDQCLDFLADDQDDTDIPKVRLDLHDSWPARRILVEEQRHHYQLRQHLG